MTEMSCFCRLLDCRSCSGLTFICVLALALRLISASFLLLAYFTASDRVCAVSIVLTADTELSS